MTDDRKTVTLRTPLPESEYDPFFLQGMVNRMAVSNHKYGNIADSFPHKTSALDNVQLRIRTYLETGNTEYLIDAANFAMIEFMYPSVENAFFEATDSDGSPGVVRRDG